MNSSPAISALVFPCPTAMATWRSRSLIWGKRDLGRLDGWVGRRAERWQSRRDWGSVRTGRYAGGAFGFSPRTP
jgi:hypothetical protein